MSNYRRFLKAVFYKLRLANFLDWILFRSSQIKNKKQNFFFRKQYPDFVIPPDYFLYETYVLNYKAFFEQGEESAKEVVEWTGKYIHSRKPRILDFGCGVSRVIVHLKKFVNKQALLFGCDVNEKMIEFNKNSYSDISYLHIPFVPPTSYENDFFDLIYAFSIFTHIRASLQETWLKEIHRILKSEGIFLLTTHGRHFDSKLLDSERKFLEKEGVYTKNYRQEGHRMMSTYNEPNSFRKLLQLYFDVLEFYDGSIDLTKTEGQDLWIVKKKELMK